MGQYNKCTILFYVCFLCSVFYLWKISKVDNNNADYDSSKKFEETDRSNTKQNIDKNSEMVNSEKGKRPPPCRTEKECCDKIIANNTAVIQWGQSFDHAVEDEDILADLSDCDTFFRKRNYVWGPSSSYTTDEAQFPFAYSVMVHMDLAHLESLMKAIYQPQNLYCIHVDKKSVNLREKVARYLRCFPNVFLTNKTETVYWGGYGVLKATTNCMEDLVQYDKRAHNWEYFINLAAQDFPLKTNLELVETLKTWSGASNVEILTESNKAKYEYRYEIKYNKFGNPDSNVRTTTMKDPPPYNVSIYKGNLATVMARDLCDWIVTAKEPQQLLTWLADTDVPDEHYWATLIKNKNKFALHGHHQPSFSVVEPYIARYSLWKHGGRKQQGQGSKVPKKAATCGGKFVRDVCVFGVADLGRLTKLPHLFANKFYLGYQSMAYKCMTRWLRNKRETEVFLVDQQESLWAWA